MVRQRIERTNDFKQAGERYRSFEEWEREELINNLGGGLSGCRKDIRDKMIEYFRRSYDPSLFSGTVHYQGDAARTLEELRDVRHILHGAESSLPAVDLLEHVLQLVDARRPQDETGIERDELAPVLHGVTLMRWRVPDQ